MEKAAAAGVSFDEMKSRMIHKISMRKMVTADDIAETALFLCTESGASISGQALSVCGDLQVLECKPQLQLLGLDSFDSDGPRVLRRQVQMCGCGTVIQQHQATLLAGWMSRCRLWKNSG